MATGEYNCFFGDQTCPNDGSAHPKVKCDCLDSGKWNCVEYDPCGLVEREPMTTCPDKHPLDFPYKLTCKSDFLVCNYGRMECCGDALPTSTCECTVDGEFTCFKHTTCRYRDCTHVPSCPTQEPTVGTPCSQPIRSTCAYGEKQCCGFSDWKQRVHHCFEGKWDTVTDILYTRCDDPTCPTPAPTPEPADESEFYTASPDAAFPDVKIPLANERMLSSYDNTAQVKKDLEEAAKFTMNSAIQDGINALERFNERQFIDGPIAFASVEANSVADVAAASPSAEGVSDFETNNQEEGVDEADLVKSDGKYNFVGYGDILVIWEAATGQSVLNSTLPPLAGFTAAPSPAPTDDKPEEERPLFDEPLISSISIFPGRPFFRPRPRIQSLLLESDRLVLFVSGYGDEVRKAAGRKFFFRDAFNTRVLIYDTSKLPEELPLVDQKDMQGSFRDARAIGNNIHVVTTASWDSWRYLQPLRQWDKRYAGMNSTEYKAAARAVALNESIPAFVDGLMEEVTAGGLPNLSRISLWLGNSTDAADSIFSGRLMQSYVQLTSFDVTATPRIEYSTAGCFAPSSWGQTYAVGDMLVFAMQGWNWIPWLFGTGQTTYLLGFQLNGATAKPHAIGSVAGNLLNQYSLDIHDGYLRAATTIRQWFLSTPENGGLWRSRFTTSNQIIILKIPDIGGKSARFQEVARVDNLGKPREVFTTVRFFDNRAYAVTFERTDPFYVIDLSDNLNPAVLGELNITGFSSYLHPINDDNTLLLAVGQEADENGRILGLQITMFDAVDPSDPKLVQRFVVEQDTKTWSSSSVSWDFKAFRYVSLGVETGILIMPISVRSSRVGAEVGNFDGFKVYDISRNGIKERLEVSHVASNRYYGCYSRWRLPQRSLVFNGDVTTLKGHSVLSTNLDTGASKWKLDMPEPEQRNECSFWYIF